ncbi:MAG TPA: hypothetical protein VIA61_12490 [Methylomirabilota bacterium]|jgi:hypothetical protein
MADVYRSERPIADLNLVVRGAATVVLSHPDEVAGLQAWCVGIGQDHPRPTDRIFEALVREGDRIDLDRAGRRPGEVRVSDWREVSTGDLAARPVQEIVAALGLAQAVWRRQDDEVPTLALTLSVSDPGFGPEPMIDMVGDNPGWLLYRGSIKTALFLRTFRAAGFVVGVFSRGVGVEDRAGRVVDALREKQLAKVPRVGFLGRIDQTKSDELAGKCGAILFLHGLLSTDLGTFDAGIEHLRADGFREDEFLFLGWPHNTLTQIAFNSSDLCAEIRRLWEPYRTAAPLLAFVCHSRGGLLARHVAATLLREDYARWRPIIKGCVTFGTPHTGTALADAPDDLLALLIATGAWRETGTLAALSDVLWIAKRNRTLEGVEDLRTMQGARNEAGRAPFQRDLLDLEQWRVGGRQPYRWLDVLTVGAKIDPSSRWFYDMATRALSGKENDVAVPLESSRPLSTLGFTQAPESSCDHFSYFTADEVMKTHYREVGGFLKRALDLDGCEARRPRPPGGQVVETPTAVRVGGVQVRKSGG